MTTQPEEYFFLGPGSLVVRARDRDRLEAFYTALGFRVRRKGDEWMNFELGGGAWLDLGRLDPSAAPPRRVEERNAVPMMSLVRVRDLDEAVRRVEAAGGRIIEVRRVQSSALAVVADPEENVFGLAYLAPVDGGSA